MGFREDVRGDPFEGRSISLVWAAVTKWARWAAADPDRGVYLGDTTWRHANGHLRAGGCVLWVCLRSLTRSPLALQMCLQRRGLGGRGDLSMDDARALVRQHHGGGPPPLGVRDGFRLPG